VSALNGLVLWNFFPMHMRGTTRTLTDTMHLTLASNPAVPLSLVVGRSRSSTGSASTRSAHSSCSSPWRACHSPTPRTSMRVHRPPGSA
jgi:hypothetical protein